MTTPAQRAPVPHATATPQAADLPPVEQHLSYLLATVQERQPRHEKRVAAVLGQLTAERDGQAAVTLAGELLGLLRLQREMSVVLYNNIRDLTARVADLEDDTDDLAEAVESGGGLPRELAQQIAEMLGMFAKSVQESLPHITGDQRKAAESIVARCQHLVEEMAQYVEDDDDEPEGDENG